MMLQYYSATVFEVLTNPGNKVPIKWISGFPANEIPIDKAVSCKNSAYKDPFYIGRIQMGTSLIVGNIFPKSKIFCYPTDNKKVRKGFKWELLVVQPGSSKSYCYNCIEPVPVFVY